MRVELSRRSFVLTTLASACATPALAQPAYPSRPVRIVVPYAVGTSTDTVMRIFAEKLTTLWGSSVYVENLPGLTGLVGTRAWVHSPKDPHNLIAIAANHLANAALYTDLQFRPIDDFSPIVDIGRSSFVLVVPEKSPYKTLGDLVAGARANPGKLNYASGGVGGPAHLVMETVKKRLNFPMVHVPYRTVATALTAVIAGEVDAFVPVISAALPHIQSGRIRPLATTTLQRHPHLPDVPTLAESGMPGYEVSGWFGIMGPAGMDPRIMEKISSDVMNIAKEKVVLDKLDVLGIDLHLQGPEAFKQTFIADGARWRDMVITANAKLTE